MGLGPWPDVDGGIVCLTPRERPTCQIPWSLFLLSIDRRLGTFHAATRLPVLKLFHILSFTIIHTWFRSLSSVYSFISSFVTFFSSLFHRWCRIVFDLRSIVRTICSGVHFSDILSSRLISFCLTDSRLSFTSMSGMFTDQFLMSSAIRRLANVRSPSPYGTLPPLRSLFT